MTRRAPSATSGSFARGLLVVALTVGLAVGVAFLLNGQPSALGDSALSPAQGAAASLGTVALLVGVAVIVRAAGRTIDRIAQRSHDGARCAWHRFERHKSEQVLALSLLGSAPVSTVPILHDLPPRSANPNSEPAVAREPAAQSSTPAGAPDGQTRTPAAELAPTDPAAAPPPEHPAPSPTPQAGASWAVIEGDSFWRLASTVVSDALGARATLTEIDRYWRACVEQNRSGLRPPFDPDLIFPGQVVDLPEPTWGAGP